jgi:Glycosyl hydrolases family 15
MRYGYGRVVPSLRRLDGAVVAAAGPDAVVLRTRVPTIAEKTAAVSTFDVRAGERNWDYRYCWLRDATLMLLALIHAGYREEASKWRAWLLRAAAGDPDEIQIVYGVAGERRLPEWVVDWLPGFEGSRPVRVGNAAATQEQLDVYGEVMDAMYQARRHDVSASLPAWELGRHVLGLLEQRWREPDEGIWEVRGGRRHFTHSKVMAWVAFDRGIKIGEEFGREAPLERWRAIRDEIHAQVCRRGWNDQLGSFTQSYGSRQLDASLLLLPQVGFLPPADARPRHPRRHSAPARVGRLPAPLPERGGERRPPRPERAPFSPARSGSSTRSRSTAGTTKRSSCSNGYSTPATISASSPRNATRAPDACSATSRKPCPTLRSSTAPSPSLKR